MAMDVVDRLVMLETGDILLRLNLNICVILLLRLKTAGNDENIGLLKPY